jgi:hypothetical protein
VLAALVLIGLVLPLVMRGVSLSLGLAENAALRAEAAAFAEARLNELALGLPPEVATLDDGGASRFHWSSSERIVEDGMRELTVEVAWSSRGQERRLVLSTWAAPGAMEVLQ